MNREKFVFGAVSDVKVFTDHVIIPLSSKDFLVADGIQHPECFLGKNKALCLHRRERLSKYLTLLKKEVKRSKSKTITGKLLHAVEVINKVLKYPRAPPYKNPAFSIAYASINDEYIHIAKTGSTAVAVFDQDGAIIMPPFEKFIKFKRELHDAVKHENTRDVYDIVNNAVTTLPLLSPYSREEHFETISLPLEEVKSIILATDGYWRATELFGTSRVLRRNPREVIRELRGLESRKYLEKYRIPYVFVHDDATAVVINFNGSRNHVTSSI